MGISFQILKIQNSLPLRLHHELAVKYSISNGCRTEWSPIQSVIIQVSDKILFGRL